MTEGERTQVAALLTGGRFWQGVGPVKLELSDRKAAEPGVFYQCGVYLLMTVRIRRSVYEPKRYSKKKQMNGTGIGGAQTIASGSYVVGARLNRTDLPATIEEVIGLCPITQRCSHNDILQSVGKILVDMPLTTANEEAP